MMDKIARHIWRHLSKLLKLFSFTVSVHIESNPHYTIGILIGLLVTTVTAMLIMEVCNFVELEEMKIKLHVNRARRSIRSSIKTQTAYSELQRDYVDELGDIGDSKSFVAIYHRPKFRRHLSKSRFNSIFTMERNEDTKLYVTELKENLKKRFQQINKRLSVSPSQFIIREKEKRTREMVNRTIPEEMEENVSDSSEAMFPKIPSILEENLSDVSSEHVYRLPKTQNVM